MQPGSLADNDEASPLKPSHSWSRISAAVLLASFAITGWAAQVVIDDDSIVFLYESRADVPAPDHRIAEMMSTEYAQAEDEFTRRDLFLTVKPVIDRRLAEARSAERVSLMVGDRLPDYDFERGGFPTEFTSASQIRMLHGYKVRFSNAGEMALIPVSEEQARLLARELRRSRDSTFAIEGVIDRAVEERNEKILYVDVRTIDVSLPSGREVGSLKIAAATAPPPGQAPSAAHAPGRVFSDRLTSGDEGPPMVVIPPGRFLMGCVYQGVSRNYDCPSEATPVHEVTIPAAFAMSVYEVTIDDWDRFLHPDRVTLAVGFVQIGYKDPPDRGRHPIRDVSWHEAQEYVEWLSAQTGEHYRLPSEAEWEYAARAGTETKFHWGDDTGTNYANCGGCGDEFTRTAPVGSFAPNAFGLYDMHFNVAEWVEDCWHTSYGSRDSLDAPTDGSAWVSGDCTARVRRGSHWKEYQGKLMGVFYRHGYAPGNSNRMGVRVVREL